MGPIQGKENFRKDGGKINISKLLQPIDIK